jgi:hypothetical protein
VTQRKEMAVIMKSHTQVHNSLVVRNIVVVLFLEFSFFIAFLSLNSVTVPFLLL